VIATWRRGYSCKNKRLGGFQYSSGARAHHMRDIAVKDASQRPGMHALRHPHEGLPEGVGPVREPDLHRLCDRRLSKASQAAQKYRIVGPKRAPRALKPGLRGGAVEGRRPHQGHCAAGEALAVQVRIQVAAGAHGQGRPPQPGSRAAERIPVPPRAGPVVLRATCMPRRAP
jgi:hypothetical protein